MPAPRAEPKRPALLPGFDPARHVIDELAFYAGRVHDLSSCVHDLLEDMLGADLSDERCQKQFRRVLSLSYLTCDLLEPLADQIDALPRFQPVAP